MLGWRAWGRGYLRNANLTVTFVNLPWILGALWLPKKSQHPAADTRLALCPAEHPKLVTAFRTERSLLQVLSSGG